MYHNIQTCLLVYIANLRLAFTGPLVLFLVYNTCTDVCSDRHYVVSAFDLPDVMVCAVAIGNRINMGEINDIASNGCAFEASSFTRLDKMVEFAAAEGRANDFKTGQTGQQSPSLDANFFDGIQF